MHIMERLSNDILILSATIRKQVAVDIIGLWRNIGVQNDILSLL